MHWPFCQAKCPYCDFNSHVVGSVDQDRWKRAYVAEIARISAETGGRVLTSIYFGGGTPSLMAPDVVADVITAARTAWRPANDIEITLEANPTSVEADRFRGYADAGVNRVSVGIQALNDTDLRALGRLHSVSEAMDALATARDTFGRVSFDLIYARQNQSLENWGTELRQALVLQPDHLSLYQLTIEPGTAFGDRMARGGLRGLPDEDLGADMYFRTQELCEAVGLWAYEVSNHAQSGQESRHNLIYWRGGDYAGIGPGAHGRLTLDGERLATETPLAPMGWLRAVEVRDSGELQRRAISTTDQATEYLIMGLRLREGVDRARLMPLSGSSDFGGAVDRLVDFGMISVTEDSLTVTEQGRPVLNAILRDLLPDRD